MTCEDAERLLRQALGAATDTSSAAQASGVHELLEPVIDGTSLQTHQSQRHRDLEGVLPFGFIP